MKRLILFFLPALVVSAQVQNIPNTVFPAVRTLMNSNFLYLDTNKAGLNSCTSGQFAVQTTASGVVCLAVSWSVITGKPSTFTPSTHASTHASGGSDPVTLTESQVTSLTSDLALKAPLASPTFTGTVTIGTTCPAGTPTGSVCVGGQIVNGTTAVSPTAGIATPDFNLASSQVDPFAAQGQANYLNAPLAPAAWPTSLSTVTAPNGTSTAGTMTFTFQFQALQFAVPVLPGQAYVVSAWIKTTGSNSIQIYDQSQGATLRVIPPTAAWTLYSALWVPTSANAKINLVQDRNPSGFGTVQIWNPSVTLYLGSVASRASVQSVLAQTPLSAWGDSLTAGCCNFTGSGYPSMLARIASGFLNINNGGVGGYTSTQIRTAMLAASTHYGDTALLWAGRNNYSDPTTVLADVAAMVAALTTSPKKFVVLSVINGAYPTEFSGQAGYTQIASLNASLAAAYPNNYLDVRSLLVANYNPADSLDVQDHANDTVPTSLHDIDFSATLTNSIVAGDTSFQITSTSGAPYQYLIFRVGSEYLRVESFTGSGNPYTVTVTRGYGGSTAASGAAGDPVQGFDTIHLSPVGYAIVARSVYRWLDKAYGYTHPMPPSFVNRVAATSAMLVGDGNGGAVGTTAGSTNKAVCWKANNIPGWCSTVVAADGSCTCN